MTDEQKYNELLKEIAKSIKDKNDTIRCQQYIIDGLKEKLSAAEKEIKRLKGSKRNEEVS